MAKRKRTPKPAAGGTGARTPTPQQRAGVEAATAMHLHPATGLLRTLLEQRLVLDLAVNQYKTEGGHGEAVALAAQHFLALSDRIAKRAVLAKVLESDPLEGLLGPHSGAK